jgi:hypothetical protein
MIKEKQMPKAKEEVIMEKATQVAFLSLKKCHITPLMQDNGRIAFRVKGNITKALGELQENPKVNILDYLQKLETIRSLIFTLKGNGNRVEKI